MGLQIPVEEEIREPTQALLPQTLVLLHTQSL